MHWAQGRYFADKDLVACEKEEKPLDSKFRGRALSLDRVRTKLRKTRQEVELYEAQGEGLWKELHPVCRCGLLVELRTGNSQGYHYRCRETGPLCHVEYYNGGDAWQVPYEYMYMYCAPLRTDRL